MNDVTRIPSLSTNQSGPRASSRCTHGKCQPPKKSVTASADSVIMFTYSAFWNRPQRMPLYSVAYPATSSVSASGRSKGGRDVSAVPPIRNTTSPTNCGMKNQSVACCFWTTSTRLIDCAIRTTPSTESASDTSYETSCAHVRIDPSMEYLESDDQPPTMKP